MPCHHLMHGCSKRVTKPHEELTTNMHIHPGTPPHPLAKTYNPIFPIWKSTADLLTSRMLSPRQFRASSFSANRLGVVERPEHTPESGRCPSETLSWQTAPVVIHLHATQWAVAERERYPDSNRSLPIRSSIFANSSLGTATSATPVRAGRSTRSLTFGHLEDDVARMMNNLGSDLDELVP